MNGAESLVRTLLAAGVDTCFANPGTSEMHFVAALDRIPGMRCVLGLQENVVTGMADGYFRISGKPACTLLHCGPGLANGLANLHNARRAGSGIVNIVGDHATYHRELDSPLTADTYALARSMSAWVRTSYAPEQIGADAAAAVQATLVEPGQVATLILPSDMSWGAGGIVAAPLPRLSPPQIDPDIVKRIANVLRRSRRALILLAHGGVQVPAQKTAHAIATATGASLLADYVNGRVPRGRGRLPLERVPYSTQAAIEMLKPFDDIILVNAKAPVGFFAYPELPSRQYAPHTQIHTLSRPDQDAVDALAMLSAELCISNEDEIPDPGPRPEPASGRPTPEGLGATLAALMPENSIISDESLSFGRGFYKSSLAAPVHDWLHLTGGAIGDGLPVATGAAIAAGGTRRTISLQADGSAMYSLQALWTQGRERLPCTTIILNNRSYKILIDEYRNVGAQAGPTAMNMLDLSNPPIDWVKMANAMGVEAASAVTMEQCADLMRFSFASEAPFLIELMI